MSAYATSIDPTLNGDTTADGRVVNKSELEQQFQAAADDFDALSAATVRYYYQNVTVAELNAGEELIAGISGKQITVLDFKMIAAGTFTELTSVELEDESATISVASVAAAGLANTNSVDFDDAACTLGAGFGTPLTANEGLSITKTGTDESTATSVKVYITYTIG